jgi:threonine aldolase
MNFASDNWAGAHPKIADALAAQAGGFAPAYGTSDLDRKVEDKFCEIFERNVSVFFVATGTAANSLSLASASRPGGVAFCHREAHVVEDECGAPEYLSGGMRLHPLDGALGKIDPDDLVAKMAGFDPEFVHWGQPAAVSITQSTEIGTVYSADAIGKIGAICREKGLPFHMDGARFANALVSLGTTPAEMTWKRGVDLLSFGGTKNGCWCAEAIVVFDPGRASQMPFIRKRAAQLFSKSRFIAAQFDAYLADDLWLETARHANAMAGQLAARIERSQKIRLAWKPEANEIFAVMTPATAEMLTAGGAAFHEWKLPAAFDAGSLAADEKLWRFVTSFATTTEEVAAFGALI